MESKICITLQVFKPKGKPLCKHYLKPFDPIMCPKKDFFMKNGHSLLHVPQINLNKNTDPSEARYRGFVVFNGTLL